MSGNILKVEGTGFTLNGNPFDMWGIRLANALENDKTASDVIRQMDTYKSYGVNTMSVFLMGGSSGSSNPFHCDGSFNPKLRSSHEFQGRGNCEGFSLNNSYLDRLAAIIEAADERGMVINAGIFYQMRIELLADNEAVRRACRNTAAWLKAKGYRNIFMDLVNEYAHPGFEKRDICYGMKQKGDPDGGELLIHDFKSVYPDIPVSISGCGFDVEDTPQLYINFAGQDLMLIHYRLDPVAIRKETGLEIPIVCNEWGPGVALEPNDQLGRWTFKDREEWETTTAVIRNGGGFMFIFSMWKQTVTVSGPHFETGPAGAQPQATRSGEPSDEWMFGMVRNWSQGTAEIPLSGAHGG